MLLLFSNTAQASSTRGQLRVRIGTDWPIKPVKVWNGSAWVKKNVRYWNGTTWVFTFDNSGYTFYEDSGDPGTYAGTGVKEDTADSGTYLIQGNKIQEDTGDPGTYVIQ